MSDTSSPALRLSGALLRLLIVLNILGGVILVACFVASFAFRDAMLDVLREHRPAIDLGLFVPSVRLWMLLALPGIYALHILFKRTLDILATVRLGSPFVIENAARLRTIGWCLLAVQGTHLLHGVMVKVMASANAKMDWDFSLVGWLCVGLLFVLARVFEEGARMRDDLEAMI